MTAASRSATVTRPSPVLIAAAAALVLLGLRWSALDAPPGPDASISIFPAAVTLAGNGFDLPELLRQPHANQGGANTHAISLVTWLIAGVVAVLDGRSALIALHVLSVALAAVLAGLVYALARRHVSTATAVAAAGAAVLMPIAVQQASEIYLDLPLAVAVTAMSLAVERRRLGWATLAAFVAVATKVSAVFVIPLLFVTEDLPLSSSRRWLRAGGAAALAALPAIPTYLTSALVSDSPGTLAEAFGLVGSSATMLVLTVDVAMVLLAFGYLWVRAGGSEEVRPRSGFLALVLVTSFFVTNLAVIASTRSVAILPRYYIAVMPLVLVAIAVLLERFGPRVATAGLAGLILVSLVNVRGDLYPAENLDFYVVTERSTRASLLIDLYEKTAHRLTELDDRVKVVDRENYFRLEYPELGYVRSTPDGVLPVVWQDVDTLPQRFVVVIDRPGHSEQAIREFEERARVEGYSLRFETITSGPFSSTLVLGDAPS